MATIQHIPIIQKKTGQGILAIMAGVISIAILLGLLGADVKNALDAAALSQAIAIALFWTAMILLVGAIRGIRDMRLIFRYNRLMAAWGKKERLSFSELEQIWQKPLDKVLNDLLQLTDWQLLMPDCVDLVQRELLVQPSEEPPQAKAYGQKRLQAIPRKSAMPVYAALLTVLLYALVLPLTRLSDLIILIIMLATIVGFAYRLSARRWKFSEKIEEGIIDTGNADLDVFMRAALSIHKDLKAHSQRIAQPKVAENIISSLDIIQDIFDFIAEHPQKIRQLRQFMEYYLPAAIKLLDDYAGMEAYLEKGDNIRQSMSEIEALMDTLPVACRRELDHLYEDKALDISAEIAVMRSLIRPDSLEGIQQFLKRGENKDGEEK